MVGSLQVPRAQQRQLGGGARLGQEWVAGWSGGLELAEQEAVK